MARKKQKKSKNHLTKKVNDTYLKNQKLLNRIINNHDYLGQRFLLNEYLRVNSNKAFNHEWLKCFKLHIEHCELFCENILKLVYSQKEFINNKALIHETIHQMNAFTVGNAEPLFLMAIISIGTLELPEEAFEIGIKYPEEFKRLATLQDTTERICDCLTDIQSSMKKNIYSQTLHYLEVQDKVRNF